MAAWSIGFSPRKRRWLALFAGERARPWREGCLVCQDDTIYVWGDTFVPSQLQHARIVRVEDGFVRSVGLGAAFAPPASWVFDSQGLHHWGHSRTDLEDLLNTYECSESDLRLGAQLLHLWRALRLSKYNLSDEDNAPFQFDSKAKRSGKRILAIGQVASDAALRGIAPGGVRSNMGLLANIRRKEPDAHIVYKRHPDVVSRLRPGDDADALLLADQVVESQGLRTLALLFDEIHVINSLAGFEALMLGAKVVCHATPFYAGWGLTQDLAACPRRTKRRTLQEVVAIALGLYPRYICPKTRRPASAQEVFQALHDLREQQQLSGWKSAVSLWLARQAQGLLRLRGGR